MTLSAGLAYAWESLRSIVGWQLVIRGAQILPDPEGKSVARAIQPILLSIEWGKSIIAANKQDEAETDQERDRQPQTKSEVGK